MIDGETKFNEHGKCIIKFCFNVPTSMYYHNNVRLLFESENCVGASSPPFSVVLSNFNWV